MIRYQSCLWPKGLRKTRIKKFLTIRKDCDRLTKLSQSERKRQRKENKKSCWQTIEDMLRYQSCWKQQKRTLITEQWKTLKDSKRIIQANRKIWRTHLRKVDVLNTVKRRKSNGRIKAKQSSAGENYKPESLILAQDERWRRA